MKNIYLLGASGSIGKQTLDVISRYQDKFVLKSYSDNTNVCIAKEIIKKIQMMPEGYKQIFNLYAIEGYKHIEIAKLLQISESTSKSQYAKAKKWLQIHLEDNK